MKYFIGFIIFLVGCEVGRNAAPIPPTPTIGQRITALHHYMKDPYTRQAWKNNYCGKQKRYEDS